MRPQPTEEITEWIALNHDAVQSVPRMEGARVRTVTFPLGKIYRDRFLKSLRERLKLRAAQQV
jgi:hypothetical protein